MEFKDKGFEYISQPKISIHYKNKKLKKYYEPDFIVNDKIVIEIKAMKQLGSVEEAQIINSLRCCKREIGLLINFGEESLNWKRFVLTKNSCNSRN